VEVAGENGTRAALAAMTEADIVRIGVVPELCRTWAKLASVRSEDLLRGKPRAALAVRISIQRDYRPFAESLSQLWDNILVDRLEHQRECHNDDGDLDELSYAAGFIANLIGTAGAKAFLHTIAGRNLDIAGEVSRRMDELCELAEDPPEAFENHDHDVESFGDGTVNDDGPNAVDDELHEDADETRADTDALADVAELLSEVRVLLREGADLADRLREAATAIEQGRPAAPVGTDHDDWSVAARAMLAATAHIVASDDLETLREGLVALEGERSQQRARLQSDAQFALRLIGMAQLDGRDAMITEFLDRFGFASVEEVQALAAGESSFGDLASAKEGIVTVADEPHDADEVANPEAADPLDDEPAEGDVELEQCSPQAPPVYGEKHQGAEERLGITDPVSIPAVKIENEAPVDDGESVSTLVEYPWDTGDPPLIGQLLLDGREAVAYHLAEATGENETRRQLLKFACASAHCSRDALELSLLPSDSAIRQLDGNESRLLLAASLRAGLRLGYAPVGLQSLLDSSDLATTGLQDVLRAAANAVNRGGGRASSQAVPSTEELMTRWAALGDEAAQRVDALRRRVLKYQRGSKVIHHLARDGQPLGQALSTAALLTAQGVAGVSSPAWADIEQLVADLQDQGEREKLINTAEAAVSTSQQLRRGIIAGARAQLHECLIAAGELLSRLVAVRRAILSAGDLKDIASAEDLDRTLSQLHQDLVAHAVGDAALIGFVEWLRADPVEPVGSSIQKILDAALLELFELPRDSDGGPARNPTVPEVTLLLAPREPDLVVEGYLDKGDIANARAYIAESGLEGGGYDDKIQVATKIAKRKFETALADAEQGVARLRALYKDELARELSESVYQISDNPPGDRFDVAVDALRDIAESAENALSAEREALVARARALVCDEDSKARVLDRLDKQDETLAVEFLTLLETGQPLPEAQPLLGDDFGEFFPKIVEIGAAAQSSGADVVGAVRTAMGATTEPVDRHLRDGMAGWATLRDHRRGTDQFRISLANVLRMLGLAPRSQDWAREISRTKNAGYATFRVFANPVDRSYVPQFGTQAHGSYDVTLAWDKVTPARLFDFIDERNATRPNIVLHFGVLNAADRLHLRALTRASGGKGFSPLVIDSAMIGWLSTRTEPGWRFTQRVTLPFTTLNPYSPYAGGEVPDEVFVGRAEERRDIEDPTGSMFVYGGRQLGKSALLRRVERMYTDPRLDDEGPRSGRVAVYIDLKAAGIGEAQEPAALWPLLRERLKDLGVIQVKGGRAAGVSEVTSQITQWLDGEPSNQLLVLLDEADNFLTADSNWGDPSDRGSFPVLQALKGLMEHSDRRFKVVFAGLHQVQRFHDTSNTPVAHGGDDILIGPLKTVDAYALVVDPMAALGYRFDNPELVWRLLLVTNYQASLVQIVCEALVNHLQKRAIPEDGGRIVVTDSDVREVCTNNKVRELIAQRFRWTINLDSRYRVIALVVAMYSLMEDPGTTFAVDDLRTECEANWPAGFSPSELSRNEFERYLVEMKGLGILYQHEDQWALRSPNIIQMLGSPERLGKELDEAASTLERPLEYNPTMARQIIGDSEGIAAPRSPLTDHEVTTLLRPDPHVQVVFGTPALGVDRVAAVLEHAARVIGLGCITVDRLQAPELKRAGTGGKQIHVVVDLTQARSDVDVSRACRELSQRKNVSATIVLGPGFLPILESLEDQSVHIHKLRRWSIAGLRAWYGSPFEGPESRARLHSFTSGWPKLIEEVMDSIARGVSQDDSLETLKAELNNAEVARQVLDDCGVDRDVARSWVKWFATTGTNGPGQSLVTADDISEAIDVDGPDLLDQLESLDVVVQDGETWALDGVVLAAAATLFVE
jgi:hypothetical protein